MQRFKGELKAQERSQNDSAKAKLHNLVARQRTERQAFKQKQAERQKQEAVTRQSRFRTGYKGLWDRLRGKHKPIRQENEHHYQHSLKRDRTEKNQLIAKQLAHRQMLRHHAIAIRQPVHDQRREINRDITGLKAMRNKDFPALRDAFIQASRGLER